MLRKEIKPVDHNWWMIPKFSLKTEKDEENIFYVKRKQFKGLQNM